jgi:transcriptional regulator with XRE-family HTH domain
MDPHPSMDVKQTTRQAFAQRLARALSELGFNGSEQKALGELFSVSGQAVRKWLSGETLPSNARMPHIASKLGVRRAWLMDGEGPMRDIEASVSEETGEYVSFDLAKDEQEIIRSLRRLPYRHRDAILELVKQLDPETGAKYRENKQINPKK